MSFERGTAALQSFNDDDTIICGISLARLAERFEHMAKMDFNPLMKNSGVLSDTELNNWLDGANLTMHPDNFGGFEIVYGFDRDAQHFVVVKSQTPGGPHFALVLPQGATS